MESLNIDLAKVNEKLTRVEIRVTYKGGRDSLSYYKAYSEHPLRSPSSLKLLKELVSDSETRSKRIQFKINRTGEKIGVIFHKDLLLNREVYPSFQEGDVKVINRTLIQVKKFLDTDFDKISYFEFPIKREILKIFDNV